jgi:hypothetical protein
MKKLKRLKKIQELLDEFSGEMKSELDKSKKEHQKIILESNSKLISDIAKGENLDELYLIEKYLKKTKNKPVKEEDVVSEESEDLLCHIKIKGSDFFYEDKLNGNVYDSESKKVGQYKYGSIKLSEN